MRIKFMIAAFAATANAAPAIITRYHTAPAVTQWVTYTTNTVLKTNIVVATVSGPPPAAEVASSPETSTVAPSATAITSSTPEAEATTPATTSTSPAPETEATTPATTSTSPVPETEATTSATTSTSPAPETEATSTSESTSSTPTTTSSTPTTTSTTPMTTSTTPTTTSTTPTTTSTTPTTTSTTPTTTSTTPITTSTTPTTSTTTSSSSSAASTSSGLNSFESAILNEHNVKRALHGVGDLVWNTTLVDYAVAYAAEAFSCDNVQLIHSGGPYGENLAAGYVGGASPVDAWYDEISLYNFDSPGFSEATGHFTQVVWKDTTQLGCALVACNNEWRQYTICEYSESRGNIVGTDSATGKSYFEENVLPPV